MLGNNFATVKIGTHTTYIVVSMNTAVRNLTAISNKLEKEKSIKAKNTCSQKQGNV